MRNGPRTKNSPHPFTTHLTDTTLPPVQHKISGFWVVFIALVSAALVTVLVSVIALSVSKVFLPTQNAPSIRQEDPQPPHLETSQAQTRIRVYRAD
ncbi:MAG TPA: hypothetical protein VK176_06850 [Phycisphaerales bacterium]|nr:hypothetical protein [Phycisphaerales bacterium]